MFSPGDTGGYHGDAGQGENRFRSSGFSQACRSIRGLRVCVKEGLKQRTVGIKPGKGWTRRGDELGTKKR